MGYLGYKPADKPLTSADITDSIITSAKIVDGTIANADIADNTIALAKLSATGTASSATFLRGDNTWGSAGATAGQVIQVLGATDSTQRTTTSLSYVTASNTLSVSITPASTSNKILILVQTSMDAGNDTAPLTIYRGSTNLGTAGGLTQAQANAGTLPGSMLFLDSPSTTSSITYQVYMKCTGSGSGSISIQAGSGTPKPTGSIVCMEIKG